MQDRDQKLQNAANEIADQVAEPVSHAIGSMEASGHELRNKAASAAHSVKKMAGQVGHAVSEGYDQISEKAGNSWRQGRDVAMRWEDRLEDSLQERPLLTILGAATVGLLLGVFLMKRHRD